LIVKSVPEYVVGVLSTVGVVESPLAGLSLAFVHPTASAATMTAAASARPFPYLIPNPRTSNR
jgi:hypothetical protein